MDLFQRQEQLHCEAKAILFERGVVSVIESYGEIDLTGSYGLKTMYKKDIDISLCNEALSYEAFFELGAKLATLLKPHGLFGRNTKVRSVENRPPDGYYWGFQFEDWKMDLWNIPRYHLDESRQYAQDILNHMTEDKRLTILEIKAAASSSYNRGYSSKEVYQAVIYEQVDSVEAFAEWLHRVKGLRM